MNICKVVDDLLISLKFMVLLKKLNVLEGFFFLKMLLELVFVWVSVVILVWYFFFLEYLEGNVLCFGVFVVLFFFFRYFLIWRRCVDYGYLLFNFLLCNYLLFFLLYFVCCISIFVLGMFVVFIYVGVLFVRIFLNIVGSFDFC